jgi:hypothetical protein
MIIYMIFDVVSEKFIYLLIENNILKTQSVYAGKSLQGWC